MWAAAQYVLHDVSGFSEREALVRHQTPVIEVG